jgi:hypothetical protein
MYNMSRSQNKIRKEMSEENMSKQQLDNQAAELKNCNDLIKELVALLEYEEALTVDTRSQQRMSAKLIELGLWPSR